MPYKAKLFIGITIVVGFSVLLASLLTDHRVPAFDRFLHLLVLAALAATFKIRLPGMQQTIAVNFVLFLIAVATLTLGEALIITAVSCAVQCLWRPRKRPMPVQVVFNVASTMLSTAAAFGVTTVLRASDALVPELVIAAAVFFVVNAALVSIVVALVSGQPVLVVWRSCDRWAFPYYLIGAALATVITLSSRTYGWLPAIAMVPLMYLVYVCYDRWVQAAVEPELAAQ